MKYLGVDFGLRRIGLAISEGELASPWQIIEVNNFSDAIEKTSKIINEGLFEEIIIGLPEGQIGKKATKFAAVLRKKGFEVKTEDETLSSKKALATLIEQGAGQKKRRFKDAFSAAEILQNYLDSV
ncbi:hypothetical protein A3J19_05195 [Candidatus Daviesbacteria bacterium RIFCSPLOWO2_02_FULL_41_8]|uniref:Putative pre-16S rRNA nuclease n=1 Tax=Candidatus Daviesbacteria bacterium RIFCSPLOWO2_02_FULL_41_8 TaxID=1797798 RepID=A0A1F5NLP1_9BACT|nr:MAG: hypothetical protein A2967_01835 [Candidatus Daviesbacteria bacterium RIFCSPLOWO2_01_FULL_41_32]OGE78636.1 MAG: hypothetical protein A3J19_05195 [Candidatus Daviesbacteria bacterium RIFCSPLOWO2_02_FULL_41_8]